VCAALLAASCSSSPAKAPLPHYDAETGQLRTLETDANENGRIDTVSYMDGARIVRIELDQDENGHVERWDFYDAAGQLEKVGLSRSNDGVMDAVAFYDPAGVLKRMEISTARDGRFDRAELYEHGRLSSSADDTNRDGRPDKWDSYRVVPASAGQPVDYTITATSFDDSGSGRPERRFVYGNGGAIARVEIDPEGDGLFVSIKKP